VFSHLPSRFSRPRFWELRVTVVDSVHNGDGIVVYTREQLSCQVWACLEGYSLIDPRAVLLCGEYRQSLRPDALWFSAAEHDVKLLEWSM